ncbi:MAG: TonB-dependent receptor [Brevundimonas sp.]|nr:TonB-dependent receptor [Brevundimonas sp.]MDZ4060798.1 TonB-dependent receptor [Brevundimonas sp.]
MAGMLTLPLLCLSLLGMPVTAQQDGAPQAQFDTPAILEDVIVTGRRRGDTGLTPELELGLEEIHAIGAYDVGEVVARLADTLSPDRPPIIIVNGRRIVNASDFLRFPPDALVRVEALPPEAASLFGGEPAQRVVNIVMQPRFKSRDAQLAATFPTGGGTSGLRGDLRQSEIQDDNTLQFGAQAARTTALWSDERPGYRFDHPDAPLRTLAPFTRDIAANFSTTRPVGDWSASLSMMGSQREARATVPVRDGRINPIEQSSRSLTAMGGMTGEARGWNVRAALNALTIQSEQGGLNPLSSDYRSLVADMAADRRSAVLPAGPLRISLSSRHEFARSVSFVEESRFTRSTQDHDVRASLAVPLLNSRRPGATNPGDASLALGARARADGESYAVDDGYNAALVWTPSRGIRLNARWSTATDSPSARQRLDPTIQGPTRVLFDFRTGRAADVATLLGGNPDLRPQNSTDAAIGLFLGPFTSWRIGGGSTLSRTETTDGIASLPGITPEVEAAFPERFVRDANGGLIRVDLRPVNMRLSRHQALASTLNLSIPLNQTPGRTDSIQLGLRHSLQLSNALVIREGFIEMDRLAGDSGGQSRHQLALTIDSRLGKWGFNGSMQWRSGSRTRRNAGHDGPDDLIVDPMATVDLRLSYLLTRSVPSEGSAPGRRDDIGLDLTIDNLFDSRPGARLGDGRIAPGYGRHDRDPIGRSIVLMVTRRF